MKEWIDRYISDLSGEERRLEEEVKTAVENQRWQEVHRLAEKLCEYRTARWMFEAVLEHHEKSNQKEVL